ncbi:MAG TPA: cellulose biosynthesis protein BcsS [Pseudolabrys sp.]|nr:cellulose biosynthesis protein BcsS [Pseudolabrys sp.]
MAATGASSAADVALPVKAAPLPVKVYSTVLFAGFDDRERSYYGYGGVVHAFNGNLAADGFLFRAMGLYNPYSYQSLAVVGGNVDGKMTAFDVLVGYQKVLPQLTARFFVGLDYEGHSLSPDNVFDSNRGHDYGVHLRGELETPYFSKYYGSLLASYGSAKERYWVRGRAGYNFNGVIVGPEGMGTGNKESQEGRVGAFVTIRNFVPFELSLSGGYSNTKANRGGASAYGTVELSVAF